MTKFFLKNFFILIFLAIYSANAQNNCQLSQFEIDKIIFNAKIKKLSTISHFPKCYKNNRKLILKLSFINPNFFEHADNILKEDELFINRILKVHPSILQYASKTLRGNIRFMQNATYIQRDSLNYATISLKNNKNFMKKMVTIDSRNYLFLSKDLKSDIEIAKIAFMDNGLLIKDAPKDIKSNLEIAKIAIKSNNQAIDFLSNDLKKNKEILALSKSDNKIISNKELRDFLIKNYTETRSQKGLAINIINQGKYFKDNILAQRRFVTKWHHLRDSNDNSDDYKVSLIEVNSRNIPISWQDDFKNYPLLIKKVNKFLKKHNIDDSTIDNLKTTYFWLIKNDLPTIAFNIYGIRSSKDSAIGPEFSDITSLTVIAQKQGERWNMSVIEVIFSSEVKTDIAYLNGHKKYILWDLYKIDDSDLSPKVIFKVEDRFREYFEVYQEQSGGKYHKIQTYKMY